MEWSESFASWSRWPAAAPRRRRLVGGTDDGGPGAKAGGTYRVAYETLQLHRRLRPDGRVPDLLVGDRVEPARAHAARLRPRRRAAGNKLVPDIATDGAGADRRRQDLHLPPQARDRVRPAGRSRGDLEGRALRVRAHREPEERCAVRLLLLGDRGLRRLRCGQGEDDLGDRTPDAHTIVFHLTPPSGDFPYRVADAGDGADPGRGREVLRGQVRRSTAATRSRRGRT